MSVADPPEFQKFARHVNPALARLLGAFGAGRSYVRASGARVWDHDGREYLDFCSAFGALPLGHNPQRIVERAREFLSGEAPNVLYAAPLSLAGELAAALAERCEPLTRCMAFASASEAVDAALKLARAATKRSTILYCNGAFHGTGIGGLSVGGSGRLRDPFEPLVPDCIEIPYSDLEALARELRRKKVAAFVVEPIGVEGGVVLPREGYLKDAKALCERHGALLVVDEARTGLARAGKLLAHQLEGVVPDVVVLGEALGGGVVPVAATLATADAHDRAYARIDRFDLNASVFGGYALGARVALEVLAAIEEQDLAEAARARGDRLRRGLADRISSHPFVRSVRGRGLLVGVELGPTQTGLLNRLLPSIVSGVSRSVFGQWLALRLLERGVLCHPASLQWNVLRLEPPLIVTDDEIDRVVDAIAGLLWEYEDLAPLLADIGQRLGAQVVSGLKRA